MHKVFFLRIPSEVSKRVLPKFLLENLPGIAQISSRVSPVPLTAICAGIFKDSSTSSSTDLFSGISSEISKAFFFRIICRVTLEISLYLFLRINDYFKVFLKVFSYVSS